jgi:hypothetical protein
MPIMQGKPLLGSWFAIEAGFRRCRTCDFERGGMFNCGSFHCSNQPCRFKQIKVSRPHQDEAAFNPICTSCFDAL